jgi:hypothetical protein
MEHKWPTYEVAPDDSIHALGVVSINYARFERTNVWMLCAVANMSEEHASAIIPSVNTIDRIKLIKTFLGRKTDWPSDGLTAIRHYLKAMEILVANRNVLMHSNLIRGTENRTAVYSNGKRGQNLFQVELSEIRQVADDLNNYFYFGLNVSNVIATEIHLMARTEGMLAISQWPELLPLPVHIDPSQRKKSS